MHGNDITKLHVYAYTLYNINSFTQSFVQHQQHLPLKSLLANSYRYVCTVCTLLLWLFGADVELQTALHIIPMIEFCFVFICCWWWFFKQLVCNKNTRNQQQINTIKPFITFSLNVCNNCWSEHISGRWRKHHLTQSNIDSSPEITF